MTVHPIPCTSLGLGTRCCSERRCVKSCSAPQPTPRASSAPQGQFLLGSGGSPLSWLLCSWPSSFGASHCVPPRSSQHRARSVPSPIPCRGSPSQPAAHTHSLVLQEGDHRWINPVARALQLLNSLYGPFGKTYGIGRCAKVWLAPGVPWVPIRGAACRDLDPISHVAARNHRGVTALCLLLARFLGGPICQGGQQRGSCCLLECGGAPHAPQGGAFVPGLGCQPHCMPGPLVGAWGCSPALAPSAPHR